jgi:hypothetical protein
MRGVILSFELGSRLHREKLRRGLRWTHSAPSRDREMFQQEVGVRLRRTSAEWPLVPAGVPRATALIPIMIRIRVSFKRSLLDVIASRDAQT